MESENETLNRYYSKKKKRKKRKKFVFYTLLMVFFVLIITILSLTVFFNISDIAVTGNSHYTQDQIISASGLKPGQNLFKLNKFKIIERMKTTLPYLDEVRIDRHLPVGIEIVVDETSEFMYIQSDGKYYILDEKLKVLDIREDAPEDLPEVKGITSNSAGKGDTLSAENSEDKRLAALTVSIKDNIGDGCITSIDITTAYDISFEYMGRLTVKVGSVEGIDNKLQLVKHVIDENRSNEEAEIDVTSGNRAYYRSVSRKNTAKTDDEHDNKKTDEKGQDE